MTPALKTELINVVDSTIGALQALKQVLQDPAENLPDFVGRSLVGEMLTLHQKIS